MRNKVEVAELLGVLETIRNEQYPDIPAELIRDIVSAEYENQDNPVEGHRNAKKAIDDYLRTAVVVSDREE